MYGQVDHRASRVQAAVCTVAPIQGQALADFIAEWTPIPDIELMEEAAIPMSDGDKPWTLEYWSMNFDGSLTL